jgi:hypothetical protein
MLSLFFMYLWVIYTTSVAGRQGGGREINECYSETNKQTKTGVGEHYLETREGSPFPRG